MKKVFQSTLLFLFFLPAVYAQVVDESISSIQTGFLGIWWNNETKLAKNWALRFEIGYEAPVLSIFTEGDDAFEIYSITSKNNYPIFLPVLSLEPRWYYNSKKRQGNSKNTFHNSGNYDSIRFSYYPRVLQYSPNKINEPEHGIFIIPTWGIRRNINYHWNFELGAGLGIDVLDPVLIRRDDYEQYLHDFIFNIHLRIGYKYGME